MSAMSDKVQCAVCGQSMTMINNRHLSSHGMTAADYKARYPTSLMRTESVAAKLSERSVKHNENRKGKRRSPEDVDAIRAGVAKSIERNGPRVAHNKGVPMSEDARRKLSERIRNGYASGTISRERSSPSEETRQKIAAALRGRKIDPVITQKAIETKKARGHNFAFMRGKTLSTEARQKISDANRKRYAASRSAIREPMLARIEAAGLTLLNTVVDPVFQLRCDTCGHTFTRSFQMFHPSRFHTELCDHCYPFGARSDAEEQVYQFLNELIPGGVTHTNMELIAPLELDITIPDLRIAIEYNGLYWHSEKAGKKRFYHKYKMENCRALGWTLITIFEDEWLTKRPIVESMLRSATGHVSRKIDARKCSVVTLPSEDASAFLNENHIQGRGRSSVKYGLLYDGKIVSAMTFMDSEASRRRQGWEINRFCSLRDTVVRGAAGRLFKQFVRDHAPTEVVSYANLRYGTGNVYGNIGFNLVGETVPNYWYFRANEIKRYHRYALRKTANDSKTMTEWEIRQSEGWNRIWDCGHAKWIWHPQ